MCGEVTTAARVLTLTRASGGMADALASGASEGNLVGVQVPPRPPLDGLSSTYSKVFPLVALRAGEQTSTLSLRRSSVCMRSVTVTGRCGWCLNQSRPSISVNN